MAGKLYNIVKDVEDNDQFKVSDILLPLIVGCVGHVGGNSYLTHRKICETSIDPRTILADPSNAVIPEKHEELYALLLSLVSCCADEEQAGLIAVYLARIVEREELVAMAWRKLSDQFDGVMASPEYIKWFEANANVMK